MKPLFYRRKYALLMIAAAGMFTSCFKTSPLIDAPYPDQQIYMSQSAIASLGGNNTYSGVYSITPDIYNQAQRFSADVTGGKINIPLGITRAGITTSGAYTIGIAANTDTIAKLVTAGKFNVLTDPTITTELLPTSALTIPPTVELADGKTGATFSVGINLSFLLNSLNTTPKKRYAFAITVSVPGKTSLVKSALATTVIFVDPAQVILPVANFSSYVYKETRTGNFDNLSANGVSYAWNFGDGSNIVTTPSASHVYAASGTYTVTLTTTGITGSGVPSVKSVAITIP